MPHKTAHSASTLGADILLARHGDTITTWRTDKRHDLTLARLADGSWDFAPNHLAMGQQIPAVKVLSTWERYRRDELSLKRADVRWMAKILGIWTGAAAAISGGLIWAALAMGDSTLLQQSMTGVGY